MDKQSIIDAVSVLKNGPLVHDGVTYSVAEFSAAEVNRVQEMQAANNGEFSVEMLVTLSLPGLLDDAGEPAFTMQTAQESVNLVSLPLVKAIMEKRTELSGLNEEDPIEAASGN